MSLVRLLQDNYFLLIEEANEYPFKAHLNHYCNSTLEENTKRITTFLDLVIGSLTNKDLKALLDYTIKVADDRYKSGFDLCEIQRALNGLKKAIWLKIVDSFQPESQAKALAMIGTIIEETKDALACRYVYCVKNDSKRESYINA